MCGHRLVVSSGEQLSPVVVLKARRAEVAKGRKMRQQQRVANKTGGLKRLLPQQVEEVRTPAADIDIYLAREGVKPSKRGVAGEDSNAALALQKSQVSNALDQRQHRMQRRRVQRARHQVEPTGVAPRGLGIEQEETGEEKSEVSGSAVGLLRRLRSQKTQSRLATVFHGAL